MDYARHADRLTSYKFILLIKSMKNVILYSSIPSKQANKNSFCWDSRGDRTGLGLVEVNPVAAVAMCNKPMMTSSPPHSQPSLAQNVVLDFPSAWTRFIKLLHIIYIPSDRRSHPNRIA